MSTFQFAIASIVDANTGNGLVHDSASRGYVAAERQGLKIRAKSIATLFAAIKSSLAAAIDSYRFAIKQRRDLRRLMSLSDHLLEDIGIHRGNLQAVALGISSLDKLNRSNLTTDGDSPTKLKEIKAARRVNQEIDAINERFFEQKKCA